MTPAPEGDRRARLSVVSPAFNEADNLLLLHERLARQLDALGLDWEWIVIDDHSTDGTPAALARLGAADPRVRGIRFARNFGSHAAIICGLQHATGDAAVVLAADLQDPPETVPGLLAEWRAGAHVVWAARRRREGERAGRLAFSRLYYWVMRNVVGLRGLPATGADFFLADRAVVEALRQFGETHVSVLALITWMGFRQVTIDYDKQPRAHGVSGWSLEKKVKLLLDSVTAFSYLPIRAISWSGGLLLLVGLLFGALGVLGLLTGRPLPGWTAVLVALLVLGGLQMLALGVLGEYLWRALDESRRRPRYLIESTTGDRGPGPAASP